MGSEISELKVFEKNPLLDVGNLIQREARREVLASRVEEVTKPIFNERVHVEANSEALSDLEKRG